MLLASLSAFLLQFATKYGYLRECLCKSGPVDFAWDTDLAHFSRPTASEVARGRPAPYEIQRRIFLKV